MTRDLQRYDERQRLNHWGIVLMFVLAALSGLAFFHPGLYFLSNLFGGGAWARILHPFMGVLMAVSFARLFSQLWRDNVVNDADREWRKHRAELLRGHKAAMPPAGKYNAAQKTMFWATAGSVAVLLVTGLVFWSPWFAPYFPIALQRLAVLLHSVAAVVLILATVVHVYAAIWIKGSMRAMTRGTVSAAWAKAHHALWHQEMTKNR
jgi:formate dehydrogenase subunit gamma